MQISAARSLSKARCRIPSVTFRREVLLRAGGYQDYGWPEDYDLFLRLYLAGVRFAKLPEVLVEWREHPDRLTRTDSRYSLENFLRLKAHYLALGPLAGRDAVVMWGAGMVGRRLGKQLVRLGVPVEAYIDIDPRKIGSTRHGRPVLPPEALPEWWGRFKNPALLAAVGSRGARAAHPPASGSAGSARRPGLVGGSLRNFRIFDFGL